MSKLTDLKAALEADAICQTSECRECSATECPCDQLRDMLFPANGKFDTIAQLIAVAQAAEHEPRCPFCAEERHIAGWPTQPHLSDCPLAPLVKEADDEM